MRASKADGQVDSVRGDLHNLKGAGAVEDAVEEGLVGGEAAGHDGRQRGGGGGGDIAAEGGNAAESRVGTAHDVQGGRTRGRSRGAADGKRLCQLDVCPAARHAATTTTTTTTTTTNTSISD